MYNLRMNGVELFLLGRSLMKIGEAALPVDSGPAERTVLIVIEDIVSNEQGTVSEIARRTSLPQSAISAAVARLREAGTITVETDPLDRRRTIIRMADELTERVEFVRSTTIDQALAEAISSDEPQAVSEVIEALEVLSRRLSIRAE